MERGIVRKEYKKIIGLYVEEKRPEREMVEREKSVLHILI